MKKIKYKYPNRPKRLNNKYLCSECDLYRHRDIIHKVYDKNYKKYYVCDYCVDNNKDLFSECSYCNKNFEELKIVKDHYSGEEDSICEICLGID